MFSKQSASECDDETISSVLEVPRSSRDTVSCSRQIAAKQLIERYFYQVTYGCGKSNCSNKACAQTNTNPPIGDEGAIVALRLFREKAELCVGILVPSDLYLITPCLNEDKITKRLSSCYERQDFSSLVRILGEAFTDSDTLNRSFLRNPESGEEASLDLESVRRVYKILFDLKDSAIENTLVNSLASLSTSIEVDINRKICSSNPIYYRQFLIIFENSCLNHPEYLETALPIFCKVLSLLPHDLQCVLVKMWSHQSPESLRKKIEILQQLITLRVLNGPTSQSQSLTVNDDVVIANATKCLKFFYYSSILAGNFDKLEASIDRMDTSDSVEDLLAASLELDVLDCRKPIIPFDDFINEPLNEVIAVDRDFTYYKTNEGFSFMNYNFILSTPVKSVWMFYDNRVHMLQERHMHRIYSFLRGQQPTPYLKLTVHRDNLIQDALVNLELIYQDNPQDLKKQLVVEFDGEQGLDEGGVSKEFFQLIVEHIFNPDYGMFIHDSYTQQCWFNQTSFESEAQFTLIGLILGLAIYNNIILDVHFPMVVYRKLFGRDGSLVDLKDSHPVIGKSLQDILDYQGDVENIFLCSFSLSYTDVFGNMLSHELIEGGKDIPVTNENCKKFVDLYVDYIINKSIEKQFSAFKHGFDMVTGDSPLKQLFRPEEVELLVCGSKDFDFDALQSTTEYEGGFTEFCPVIKWFWEVVHNFSLDQKKQLLMFITGSDRVPIGGLAKLKLVIVRQGPNSNSLPTAHTCFNVMLIPDYSLKSKLEERLVKAITYSKGFGLI